MLKTIKTTKQLRLDELLKLCWDNHITSGIYNSNKKSLVKVLDSYKVIVLGCVSETDIFEVTYEEEITEDTEFDCVISVDSDGYTFKTFNTTIDYLNSIYSDLVQILANIDGKYRTIWERDDHGSN